MSISFDLPASVEDQLRRELADLDVVAKEAVLGELYRQGRLTHHQLGLSLGLERHETDGLLKRHKVVERALATPTADGQQTGRFCCGESKFGHRRREVVRVSSSFSAVARVTPGGKRDWAQAAGRGYFYGP